MFGNVLRTEARGPFWTKVQRICQAESRSHDTTDGIQRVRTSALMHPMAIERIPETYSYNHDHKSVFLPLDPILHDMVGCVGGARRWHPTWSYHRSGVAVCDGSYGPIVAGHHGPQIVRELATVETRCLIIALYTIDRQRAIDRLGFPIRFHT